MGTRHTCFELEKKPSVQHGFADKTRASQRWQAFVAISLITINITTQLATKAARSFTRVCSHRWGKRGRGERGESFLSPKPPVLRGTISFFSLPVPRQLTLSQRASVCFYLSQTLLGEGERGVVRWMLRGVYFRYFQRELFDFRRGVLCNVARDKKGPRVGRKMRMRVCLPVCAYSNPLCARVGAQEYIFWFQKTEFLMYTS